jgi:hypothetical protein
LTGPTLRDILVTQRTKILNVKAGKAAMSIAGAYRTVTLRRGRRIERRGRRIERRGRRRVARTTALWLAGMAAWCFVFLTLGWLVAAGFYGLLVSG